jgi:hypothetical protein
MSAATDSTTQAAGPGALSVVAGGTTYTASALTDGVVTNNAGTVLYTNVVADPVASNPVADRASGAVRAACSTTTPHTHHTPLPAARAFPTANPFSESILSQPVAAMLEPTSFFCRSSAREGPPRRCFWQRPGCCFEPNGARPDARRCAASAACNR